MKRFLLSLLLLASAVLSSADFNVAGHFSSEKIYVGQAITLTIEIPSNQNGKFSISNFTPPNDAIKFYSPTYEGYSIEKADNGEMNFHHRITLNASAIKPLEPGFWRASFTLSRIIREQNFFGVMERIVSQPAQIGIPSLEIHSLPEENRPQDFSGAVGTFELIQEMPKEEIHVGDLTQLTITIRGTGNLNGAAIFAPTHSDFKVYPDNKEIELKNGELAKKVFTIVPKKVGKLLIQGQTFSFFNPQRGRYEKVQSNTIEVNTLEQIAATAPKIREIDLQTGNEERKEDKNTKGDFRQLYLAPSKQSQKTFVIKNNEEYTLIETGPKNWKRIKLANGHTGWLQAE